jgi:hypothetical protein
MAIEAWRAENGALIPAWLDAVAEIEALSSLANYSYEHPGDVFPEFADGPDRCLMPIDSAILCWPEERGASATASALNGPAAAAGRQRFEHVGQKHAAARGRRERGSGPGGRARCARDV